MSYRSSLVRFVGVCAGVVAVAVGTAAAYTGTPQGKKLAAELIASYKHVHYLDGSVHGSVWYCPQEIGGYYEGTGYPPPSSCAKHRAKVSWVNTLSHGRGAGAVGNVTAKGEPTIGFVAEKSATYINVTGRSCWTKQPVDYNFVKYPPFGFFPKEYMTVGRKSHNRVQLIGTMSAFGGFKEIDTLNATTHQMIGESIYFERDHKSKEQHLLTSYHQTNQAPDTPNTTPVC